MNKKLYNSFRQGHILIVIIFSFFLVGMFISMRNNRLLVAGIGLLGYIVKLLDIVKYMVNAKFDDNGVTIEKKFKKDVFIPYEKFKGIGIGKSGKKLKPQIYLSLESLDSSCAENLHLLLDEESVIRFDYDDNSYQILLEMLPENQKNMLIKSCEENLEK